MSNVIAFPKHDYGPTIGVGPSARPTNPHPDSSVGRRLVGRQLWKQATIPGTDFEDTAQRHASSPLKPSKPQQPCDFGLFSDDAKQTDLVDLARKPRP